MSAEHTAERPVGIFDSGVGGLAVYRAVREALPGEDLIYVADTRFAPYGDQDAGYVESRATQIAAFLERFDAKAIVVACNTATTVAVRTLRQTYTLPVVGIEPGIKPAVQQSVSGTIVVLATRRTIASESVGRLRSLFGDGTRIVLQPCPGLVECVEAGDLDGARTLELLREYTQPVHETGADVVVLGCTHYAFLEAQIRRLLGDGVCIVEPSRAVARQLDVRLREVNAHASAARRGSDRFFTSAEDAPPVAATASMLLGRDVEVVSMEQPGADSAEGALC